MRIKFEHVALNHTNNKWPVNIFAASSQMTSLCRLTVGCRQAGKFSTLDKAGRGGLGLKFTSVISGNHLTSLGFSPLGIEQWTKVSEGLFIYFFSK
jgi:hypothetical protein